MSTITKLLTTVVDIISDPLLYTYEFEVISTSGSCSNVPLGIFTSGTFTTAGETTITANITYTDVSECILAIIFRLLFDGNICESTVFYVSDIIIIDPNPEFHYECSGGTCVEVLGIYVPGNPGWYDTYGCNNECVISPPQPCIKSGIITNYNCITNEIQYSLNISGMINPDLEITVPLCSEIPIMTDIASGTIDCSSFNEASSLIIPISIQSNNPYCVVTANVVVDCYNNPCENSTIEGAWVYSNAFSVNECGQFVPPITNNYNCKGAEDQFSSNIYNANVCSKRGFFDYKYHKIIQNLNQCSTVNLYYTVISDIAGFIYPTASVNNYIGGPTIVSSYDIKPSYVTQNLFNVQNSNYSGYVLPIVDWTTSYALSGDFAAYTDIFYEINQAFLYWQNLLKYIFGIDFQFITNGYNNFTAPSVNSEWYADFFVSIIADSRTDNTNIFYNNGEILSSFGTPLNYTNIEAAKGGIICINANSPYQFYRDSTVQPNGLSLRTEVFKAIGNALGLRHYYDDTNLNGILDCLEVIPSNSLFSQSNTYMSHNTFGQNLNDNYNNIYQTILDGFCIECLLKKYLL